MKYISLKKVRVHNLKSIDLTLPVNELIVFTGVSGSGKSSLAFDTLYMEGQRRYVESLSTFARRQIGEMTKPDLEHASGISPTISIEQKTAGKNPRSSVGTLTEIYDYMRVLYARIGKPHCPVSGEPVSPQSRERIIRTVQTLPNDTKLVILTPHAHGKKGEFKEDFQDLLRKGFMRVRVDGVIRSLDEEVVLDGNVAHDIDVVIDRIVVSEENHSRIAEALTEALNLGNGVCSVLNVETQDEMLFSMHAFSPKSGLSYHSLEPQDFSFNSPSGMCPTCHGLGMIQEFDQKLVIDPALSIAEDCCSVASSYQTVRYGNIYDNLAAIYGFKVTTPWKKLSAEAQKVFLYGTEKKWTKMHFVHPETGMEWTDHVQWKGVLHEARVRFNEAKSDTYRKKMLKVMHEEVCPTCHGERLKAYPAATLLDGKRIAEITAMTIAEAITFFESLHLSHQELIIAEELLKEIKERLHFLIEVGLHYLTLDRTAPTLSGGEAQRVRLASQIGCGLVGITYILDEPSIGLHPRDNKRLLNTLKHLRNMGNTVIVVEHDEETIWEADRVVDFGPRAGSLGGEILVNGSVMDLLQTKASLTGRYLSGELSINIPKKRRKPLKESIIIQGATHHNLKNINVKIPLGTFLAVTGVSGSGKSSLITEILYPALSNILHKGEHVVGAHKAITGIDAIDKVIAIDQSPIGRNPRSNPATYIKLFDEIRELFSQLPESQAKGFKSGRFSFNVKEGSCVTCSGMGMIKIDMDFLEPAWVECPICHNQRFDPETLSITYKGKNIYDVLEMDVSQALEFFQNIPSIKHKLEMLHKVGLDYLKIGQPSTTLSGGEAQRIKLAKELVRPATGKTLYILDEPTTGLHFHDIHHLLNVLHHLVDRGNTVLVIEHNMDLIKTADWIIDLGPEGGKEGGKVIAEGKPEKIAALQTPTGIALHEALNHDPQVKIKQLSKEKNSPIEMEPIREISIEGAEQNNLKMVDVQIPREKLTICTGPSGSGKSSLAFDTIYAEGQRRYIESLSPYARQFVKQMPKPKVTHIAGLSPAIAIEQKAHAGNPRSTVGTMTEIYDYLRILYARLGVPHSPETGQVIQAISKELVVEKILAYPAGEKIQILAPLTIKKSDKFEEIINRLKRQGYVRIRLNGEYYDIDLDEQQFNFDRKRKNELCVVIDRLKIDPYIHERLFEAVRHASTLGEDKLIVAKESGDVLYNLSFSDESTGQSYPEITPQTFAFNKPEGMCPECLGLGYNYGANVLAHKEILNLSIASFIRLLWAPDDTGQSFPFFLDFLEKEKIDPFTPLKDLSKAKMQLLLYGAPEDQWYQASTGFQYRWIGIQTALAKAGKSAHTEIREGIRSLLIELECFACHGERLNPLARLVTIEDLSIGKLCRLPVEKMLSFIQELDLKQDHKLLEDVKKQLVSRLTFLSDVGLHYLSIDRRAPTLSGGEAQRIRLARQLGGGLTGVLYVLDEPTIGLHPHDNQKLNNALQKLKELGNTMLMVEHDPLTLKTADYILDFGPKSGAHGGRIIAQGTYDEILNDPESLTGAYLSKKLEVPFPKKRKKGKGLLKIKNAKVYNLKNIQLEFPIGLMSCISGVSGSGKSTLMHQVLQPAVAKGLFSDDTVALDVGTVSGISAFERLITITQDPLGHTVRSDVGTYTEVMDRLRQFFASLPLAKAKGLEPKHFSFNHRRGMCTHCFGLGYKKVEMHFLPPVKVVCEDCKGLRLQPLSLEVTYQGKNLGQYLKCTIDELKIVFQNHPRIVRILDTLIAVGLGYLQLGQEVVSLSGGEAQRIKLSRELSKRSHGKTLYLIDEPTTGLHSDDIVKLLEVLHKLVDKGNTIIFIEHNLDMIKNADYLIELGPQAGEKGGEVIFTGTPEQAVSYPKSITGFYLKDAL